MEVGFIGLGLMGMPMAKNIQKAGFPLTVYNRSRGKVDTMVEAGAHGAGAPEEVAQRCDIVITCLPMPADVVAVMTACAEAGRSGQIFIDCSTVDPETSRPLAARFAPQGISYLDAPVSGGVGGAAAGTLAIMVGGDAEAFQKALPVFQAMGSNIFHIGPSGSGNVVKLCNNLISAATTVAIGEMAVMAAKEGVTPETLYAVLDKSSASSRALTSALRDGIIPGNFTPGFMLELMHKDVLLAAQTGQAAGTRMLLTTLVQQVYNEGMLAGLGRESHIAVVKIMERIAGIQIGEQSGE